MSKKLEEMDADCSMRKELEYLRQENHDLHQENAFLRQRVAVEMLQKSVAIEKAKYLDEIWVISKPIRHLRRILSDTKQRIASKRKQSKAPGKFFNKCEKQKANTIGVFLHLYYEDLAKELADYICRVPDPKHIYVSTDTPEKAEHIRFVFNAVGLRSNVEV